MYSTLIWVQLNCPTLLCDRFKSNRILRTSHNAPISLATTQLQYKSTNILVNAICATFRFLPESVATVYPPNDQIRHITHV